MTERTIIDQPPTGPLQSNGSLPTITGSLVIADQRPAARLGKYEVLEQFKDAGMGSVYKVRQADGERIVVLKMVRSDKGEDPELLARFKTEIVSACQLDHPNIVPVYDIGDIEGEPFFTMEFVKGGSLSRYLHRKPQPPEAAARLVQVIARAVQHAHDNDIVHRDIKPGNILLAPSTDAKPGGPGNSPGSRATLSALSSNARSSATDNSSNGPPLSSLDDWIPKLSDFGLAKRLDTDSGHTRTDQTVGTPEYMAPEQTSTKRGSITNRTDVYALGAVLYAMLTGRPPIKGQSTLETLQLIPIAEPVAPRKLEPGIPLDLETITLKCLEKDPKNRYPSAAVLADELGRYLRKEPILARPVGRMERAWRWCLRNPREARLIATIAAILLFTAVGGFTLAAWALNQKGRADREAEHVRVKSEEAVNNLHEAEHAKRLESQRLYDARINLALRSWEQGEIGLVQKTLQDLAKSNPDQCGFEWHYLDHLCHLDLKTWEGHTGTVESVAYSPDGRWLASGSWDQTIRIWNVVTGESRILRGHTAPIRKVEFSPDGKRLASASLDGTIRLWDVLSGQESLQLSGHTSFVNGLTFISNDRLASCGSDRTIRFWDLTSGKEVGQRLRHPGFVRAVAVSRDGKRLVACSADGAVILWDVASRKQLRSLTGLTAPPRTVTMSSDGTRIAAGGDDNTVRVWNADTGDLIYTLSGHARPVYGLAFSPEGQTLASTGQDCTVRTWDVRTGQPLLTLRGHYGVVWTVAYSPGGRCLASAGAGKNEIKVWDAHRAQEVDVLRGHTGEVTGVVYSPDGRKLASCSSDHTIKLWDAETGQDLQTLRGHNDSVHDLAFSPRADRLVSAGRDGRVILWDIAGNSEPVVCPGNERAVLAVAYSPDGRHIAFAGEDYRIQIRNALTGRQERELTGSTGTIISIEYSPDNRHLAAAGVDSAVRIWDLETGGVVHTLHRHQGIVRRIAYSPDGSRLASAGKDKAIILWDCQSGQVDRVFEGHGGEVGDVVFSSDGRRFVSADDTGLIKCWDLQTGQEILRFQTEQNRGFRRIGCGRTIAVDPIGKHLAFGSQDGTISVWTANSLNPASQAFREARSVVQFCFSRQPAGEYARDRIRADVSISEPVRRCALDLLEPYRRNEVVHEANVVVTALFRKPWERNEVLAWLRVDPSLSQRVREAALALAKIYPEDDSALHFAALAVVQDGGASAEDYRSALRQAEAAVRIRPANVHYQSTLGMAQYRAGLYQEAVGTLSEREPEDAQDPAGAIQCARWAFLAMAQERLGRHQEALKTFTRVQALMANPKWIEAAEGSRFLPIARQIAREAEAVLQVQTAADACDRLRLPSPFSSDV